MIKTSLFLCVMSLLSAQEIRDLRPTVDLLADAQVNQKIISDSIDLSSEQIAKTFEPLYKSLKTSQINQVSKTELYVLPDETKTINNHIHVTYRVDSAPVNEDFRYTVLIQAPNTLAEKEEKRLFQQTLEYKCRYFTLEDDHQIFICVPKNCELQEYVIDTPQKKCEQNYHYSQDSMQLIYLEPNVTENEKRAIIECITKGVEPATITMDEVCYYVGFKPENLDLVGKDKVEQQLAEKGYVWNEQNKRYEREVLVKTETAEYQAEEGVDVTFKK